MPLAGPPPRRADRAPRAALNASNDAVRDWAPRIPRSTDDNVHLRKWAAPRGPPRWGRIGGPVPTAAGRAVRSAGRTGRGPRATCYRIACGAMLTNYLNAQPAWLSQSVCCQAHTTFVSGGGHKKARSRRA